MINSKNLICAGSILRLQIDTAIRVYAGTLMKDSNKFVVDFMIGKQINTMKDSEGHRLSDNYLIRKLSDEYPWLPKVYKKTSGYIHFSSTHIYSSCKLEKDQKINIKVSPIDKKWPDSLYNEAIEAFIASTKMLLRFVDGWIYTKSNPVLSQKLKNNEFEI